MTRIPMMRARRTARGFTLVELMIVIAIIGVLATLAIYGVRNYLATARTAEAKASVGAISHLAGGVFDREFAEAQLISAAGGGVTVASVNFLCDSANAVPAAVPASAKYQPSNAAGTDFHVGSSKVGWICLGYTLTTPIYYQYKYTKSGPYILFALGGPDSGPSGFEVFV